MSARHRRRRAWPKHAPHPAAGRSPRRRAWCGSLPATSSRRASALPAPAPLHPHPPRTGWERQTERRLRAIEQQLANQNRLLLVAILTVAGDIVLGLTR